MRHIYAINDRIANELVGLRMYILMCFRTDAEAARYFADAVNDTTSILNKHPQDYELLKLGHLDANDELTKTDRTLIITGDQLIALQQATQPQLVKEA